MKKKFLISGVAVFLVVLLCSSALFAFADSVSGVSGFYFDPETSILESYFDVSPTRIFTTSRGGTLKEYHPSDSGYYYIFNNYFNYLYFGLEDITFFYFDSLPSVGDQLEWHSIRLHGTRINDSYNGTPIYRFKLPSNHPYYARNYFCVYTPPLFLTVNSFISGFFTAAGDFFDGVMSVPVLAILVIGVPVTGLITAITLGLTVGRKKNKSYKKSRRRR